MHSPLIIATYENPDLDGVSCGYAYQEFLNKTGQDAIFLLCGTYQDEVAFLINKFGIEKPKALNRQLNGSRIIIVDASDLRGLSKNVVSNNVIEVIDHRKYFNKTEFPNAEFHVELVGAAATLIGEKFFINNIDISHSSAILLFYAIVSNTINFKAKVTTDRDFIIADWLKNKLGKDADFIRQIFEYKTEKLSVTKKSFLDSFSAFFNIGGKQIGIIQLEISNAVEFLKKFREECISIISEIKSDLKLDMIFITMIDLFEGYNLFFTNDNEAAQLLENILKLTFEDNTAKRGGIIMRKEIVPLIKGNYSE